MFIFETVFFLFIMRHKSSGFLVRAGACVLAFSPGMMLTNGASPGDMKVIVGIRPGGLSIWPN